MVRERQLFIAGRLKDLIILNGQNHYPQDIEQALEQDIELLRQGRIAAFAITDEQGWRVSAWRWRSAATCAS